MKTRRWARPVVLRYWLFQVPGTALLAIVLLVLRGWLNIPLWLIGVIIGLSIIKDVLLFPLVRHAYDVSDAGPALINAMGTAVEPLSPKGYVRVQGELWRAELVQGTRPIETGGTVRVRGIRGMTLLVEPADGKEDE